MNSKGFLVYAEGRQYVKQAYLCAMSLLATNKDSKISIVTSNKVPKKYEWAFDKIIPIPWYTKTNSRFKTEHRWKLYHASPYEKTIVLDADTLILDSLDVFWKFLDNYDLYFPTKVYTYRNKEVDEEKNPYRLAFKENGLPNLYNVIHYFKKSELAHDFYKWVELVTNNWELFYGNYCKHYYPSAPSMDITTSIVSCIMDINTDVSNSAYSAPYVTHMKPALQEWTMIPDSWQERVGVYLTDTLQLKIGNHLQSGIFHYTEESMVTNEILRKYEQCLKK